MIHNVYHVPDCQPHPSATVSHLLNLMAVAPAGDSKWTHQMETLPNAKDYRRKVKYNLLFRTFFWLVKKFLNNSTQSYF